MILYANLFRDKLELDVGTIYSTSSMPLKAQYLKP